MSQPYPIHLQQTTTLVGGIPTEISVHNFSDEILVTITQQGRLAQWIHVPLSGGASPLYRDTYLPSSGGGASYDDDNEDEDDARTKASAFSTDLLPLSHLTAHTLLGGSTAARETTGHLFAVQIASLIANRDPGETRGLLLGLGLGFGAKDASELSREMFFDVLEGVAKCL